MKPPTGRPNMPLLHHGVGDDARILAARRAIITLEGVSIEGFGVHGPRIVGLAGKWAVGRWVLSTLEDGDLIGVLSHPALEGGAIDVPWGRAGSDRASSFGYSKILMHHPEVAENLDSILAGLSVDPKQNGQNRVRLTDGQYVVVVRKDADGVPKNWILTAFKLEANTKRTDSGIASGALAGSPKPPLDPLIPPIPPKINAKSNDGRDDQGPDT